MPSSSGSGSGTGSGNGSGGPAEEVPGGLLGESAMRGELLAGFSLGDLEASEAAAKLEASKFPLNGAVGGISR